MLDKREFGLSRTRYVFVVVAVRLRSRRRADITPVKSNGGSQKLETNRIIKWIPDQVGKDKISSL
jgi:hypothetical protein